MEEIKATAPEQTVPDPISYTVTIADKSKPKKQPREYTVNIILVPQGEEQARIKRSIIEGIVKRTIVK